LTTNRFVLATVLRKQIEADVTKRASAERAAQDAAAAAERASALAAEMAIERERYSAPIPLGRGAEGGTASAEHGEAA
jgi:hypothetical protein